MYERWWLRQKLEHLLDLYELETTRFFKRHVKRGMVVVDIGANVGYYTRLFSRLVGKNGRVYAFEPDTEAFAYLKANTAHLPNVKIFPAAVSARDGEAQFYHVPRATQSHSLVPIEGAEVQIVRTVTLDSVISEKIDFIKIDVEGAEKEVFDGMSRHLEQNPFVVFEYTSGESDSFVSNFFTEDTLHSISRKGELVPFKQGVYHPVGRGSQPYANVVYRKKI